MLETGNNSFPQKNFLLQIYFIQLKRPTFVELKVFSISLWNTNAFGKSISLFHIGIFLV